MIYLTIPKGMTFRQITTVTEDKKTSETRDCLVDTTGKNIIELQSLVKDALRTNTGRKKSIELKDFTIYLRIPPNTDAQFLEYIPNHNGRYPTKTEPKLVIGKEAQKYDPKVYSSYGTFWSHHTFLTNSQKLELEEKRLAQKENRRHYGDSPLPT